MNLLLFLAVSTWHVTAAIESFQSQLFHNDRQTLNYAAAEMSKNEIRFSLELYKATANVEKGFFNLSPADIFVGLSTLYFGTQGRTREQLSNVLNYSPDCAIAQIAIQRLAFRINQLKVYNAGMRNAIFHAGDLFFKEDFRDKADMLRASRWGVNFRNGSARKDAILQWAVEGGSISDYDLTFEGEEPFVLVSSATFLADLYLNRLDGNLYNSLFYYNNNYAVFGEFIKSTNKLIYGELRYPRNFNDDCVTAQYIKLTWAHGVYDKIKTIIILPNERDGIRELEKIIDEAAIREILSNTDETLISVSLPSSLQIDSGIDLTQSLKNMHLTEMFNETNDFEAIFDASPIKMGPVFSVVEMIQTFLFDNTRILNPRRPARKSFNADHAFMILTVWEDENPLILSMSRHGWIPGVSNATGPNNDPE